MIHVASCLMNTEEAKQALARSRAEARKRAQETPKGWLIPMLVMFWLAWRILSREPPAQLHGAVWPRLRGNWTGEATLHATAANGSAVVRHWPSMHLKISAERDNQGGIRRDHHMKGEVRPSADTSFVALRFQLEPSGESHGWLRARPTAHRLQAPVDWRPPTDTDTAGEFDDILSPIDVAPLDARAEGEAEGGSAGAQGSGDAPANAPTEDTSEPPRVGRVSFVPVLQNRPDVRAAAGVVPAERLLSAASLAGDSSAMVEYLLMLPAQDKLQLTVHFGDSGRGVVTGVRSTLLLLAQRQAESKGDASALHTQIPWWLQGPIALAVLFWALSSFTKSDFWNECLEMADEDAKRRGAAAPSSVFGAVQGMYDTAAARSEAKHGRAHND